MENLLLDLMSTGNSIWASLFICLFIYVLKDGKAREKKYQDTISKNQTIILELSDKFGVVDSIQKDVSDIKAELRRG